MANESALLSADIGIYKELDEYPWDRDREFQGGLSAILGSNPTSSQIHDLTLRAQCFYLSRKKSIPISFDGYKAYLTSKQNGNYENISSEVPSSSSSSNRQSMTTPSRGGDSPHLPSSSHPTQHEADESEEKKAPYPSSFAEIVELITSGAPIPGIKEIPDTVLTGHASKPQAVKRRKPWETELPDDTQGTFGDERDDYIEQELP